MVYRCRERCPDNTLCRNRVRGADIRCGKHHGVEAAGPRYSRPRKSTRAGSRTGVQRTAHQGHASTRHRPTAVKNPFEREAREREREARRQRDRQERIETAAAFCLPVLTNGWREAVADRATE